MTVDWCETGQSVDCTRARCQRSPRLVAPLLRGHCRPEHVGNCRNQYDGRHQPVVAGTVMRLSRSALFVKEVTVHQSSPRHKFPFYRQTGTRESPRQMPPVTDGSKRCSRQDLGPLFDLLLALSRCSDEGASHADRSAALRLRFPADSHVWTVVKQRKAALEVRPVQRLERVDQSRRPITTVIR